MPVKKTHNKKMSNLQIAKRMELFKADEEMFYDRIETKLHAIEDLEIKINKDQIENMKNINAEVMTQHELLERFKTGLIAIEHAIFGVPGDPNQPGIVQRCILHAEHFATIDTFIRGHEHQTSEKIGEIVGEKVGIIKGMAARELTIKLWQMILGFGLTILLSGIMPTIVEILKAGK